MPATPGVAGSSGHRLPKDAGVGMGGGSRMELQTLLRRTKEASGDVLYIQEQFRFLQQSQPHGAASRDERQIFPGSTAPDAAFGMGGVGGSRLPIAGLPSGLRGVPGHA